ncbi:glycosyltransferase, partial [Escherichia coli]|nr:glycosyltransferase [Escherichia coli]
FDYLIDAAKYLDDNYIIIIGGQGQLTSSLNEKISKYDLSKRVKLIGRINEEDVSSYFYAADIFCLPSIERSEAYGVVQLEAMACGTPIIST